MDFPCALASAWKVLSFNEILTDLTGIELVGLMLNIQFLFLLIKNIFISVHLLSAAIFI